MSEGLSLFPQSIIQIELDAYPELLQVQCIVNRDERLVREFICVHIVDLKKKRRNVSLVPIFITAALR